MLNKFFDRINNKFFEIQLKRQFRIDRSAPKVCMWCGKNLENVSTENYGVWVSQISGTLYDCNECSAQLEEDKETFLQEFCPQRKYVDHVSIKTCSLCPKYAECEYMLKVVEDTFHSKKIKEGKQDVCNE